MIDTNDPLLSVPDKLNPYRVAASLIKQRLFWDLKLESWRSRKKIASMSAKHAGEKAIIMCNGPSLLKVDFDLIEKSKTYTFGLNKINLLFDKTSFRPDSIVAVNPFVIEQNLSFFNHTEIPLFLDSSGKSIGVKSRDNVAFLHSAQVKGEFSRDCSLSVFQGCTVTYVAMQLAFHMGFTQVAIVGCDHYFSSKGPSNKTVSAAEKDPDHFDPNYFAKGVLWELPNLFQSESAYKLADDFYRASGRQLVNATDGGKLEIFERKELFDFLNDK